MSGGGSQQLTWSIIKAQQIYVRNVPCRRRRRARGTHSSSSSSRRRLHGLSCDGWPHLAPRRRQQSRRAAGKRTAGSASSGRHAAHPVQPSTQEMAARQQLHSAQHAAAAATTTELTQTHLRYSPRGGSYICICSCLHQDSFNPLPQAGAVGGAHRASSRT